MITAYYHPVQKHTLLIKLLARMLHGNLATKSVKSIVLFLVSRYWWLYFRFACVLYYVWRQIAQETEQHIIQDLEVTVLSGDQLMGQSVKCEPPLLCYSFQNIFQNL